MGLISRIQRSFSARLSFFILLFIVPIFVLSFFIIDNFTSKQINETAMGKTTQWLRILEDEIEKELLSVETVHRNIMWTVFDKGYSLDSLSELTRNVVRNNKRIVGSAIAFRPYYNAGRELFSPYSSRQKDGTVVSLPYGIQYNYFEWDWYDKPRKTGIPGWSKPYFDEGAGNILMTTYSTPIYDPDKQFAGVFTADLSLAWLSHLVDSVKPYPNSYCVILGHDSCFIVHPDYMAQRFDTLSNPKIREIGQRMLNNRDAGKRLTKHADNEADSCLFFKQMTSHNWTLGVVVEESDIYGQLHQTHKKLIILLAAGLVLLFYFCMLIIKRISNPLRVFATSAREIAEGNFHVDLPAVRSKDEMKELYDSFVFMQKQLAVYIDELKITTARKERIESELRIASDIQSDMLPKIFPPFPDRSDIDLYALLKPAREVGGDLYDFFIQEDKLYFAIGDVSGKGVPASLFMAVTRSLFRSVATLYDNPGMIMQSVNNSIAETNEANMFVTMFMGILDLRSGVLKYCNAGHNPPLIITSDAEISFVDVKPNIPLGLFENFAFVCGETTLHRGSVLFMYTDGLTEAENYRQELYGDSRLLTELGQMKEYTSRTIISTVMDSVLRYTDGTEQSDDLTLFAIQYIDTHPAHSITLSNEIAEIERIPGFLEEVTSGVVLETADVANLNLAIEEAVTNIINHAFPKGGTHDINISASVDGAQMVFEISDNGIAFDPTAYRDPDVNLPVDKRPVGGLGIFLIRRIMDKMQYRRVADTNVLILTKNILKK